MIPMIRYQFPDFYRKCQESKNRRSIVSVTLKNGRKAGGLVHGWNNEKVLFMNGEGRINGASFAEIKTWEV